MFPLSTVAFPGEPVPLQVFEPRYRAMVAEVLAGDCRFGITLITRGHEVGGGDERARVGTLMEVSGARPEPDGRWFIVAEGQARFRVQDWYPDAPYPRARVELLNVPADHLAEGQLERAHRAVTQLQALHAECQPGPAAGITFELDDDPDVALWSLCARAPIAPSLRQALLEEPGAQQRAELLVGACEASSAMLLQALA